MEEIIKVFKGTDKDMKCRGMQYELGETKKDAGAVRCGNKGFHSCEAPLDVLQYYSVRYGSRYFAAEASGKIDRSGADDSKLASSELTLKAEIGLPGLIKAQIEYVKKNCTNKHNAKPGEPATAGYKGAATAGDSGAATAGDSGAATAGDKGAATAGDKGAATAGYKGAATAGDSGAATAGYYGAATAGNYGAATAGDYGAATSRGSVTVGENGVGTVRGNGVKIRGGLGAILVCAIENENNYGIADWKAVVVDGKRIKADVFYTLKNGEFVEAE